jgi:hypothetical protein
MAIYSLIPLITLNSFVHSFSHSISFPFNHNHCCSATIVHPVPVHLFACSPIHPVCHPLRAWFFIYFSSFISISFIQRSSSHIASTDLFFFSTSQGYTIQWTGFALLFRHSHSSPLSLPPPHVNAHHSLVSFRPLSTIRRVHFNLMFFALVNNHSIIIILLY